MDALEKDHPCFFGMQLAYEKTRQRNEHPKMNGHVILHQPFQRESPWANT